MKAKFILMFLTSPIVVLFACTIGAAQMDNVRFTITDISRLSDSRLRITFRLSTSGGAPAVLPRLGKEHLCSSLLRINVSDSVKTYRILPCSSIIQLDELILDSTNGVILRHDRTYTGQVILKQRELPVRLRSGSYRFQAEFNLKEFNITSQMGPVYKRNLKSNQFVFKAK
jgi:hypothetical protein